MATQNLRLQIFSEIYTDFHTWSFDVCLYIMFSMYYTVVDVINETVINHCTVAFFTKKVNVISNLFFFYFFRSYTFNTILRTKSVLSGLVHRTAKFYSPTAIIIWEYVIVTHILAIYNTAQLEYSAGIYSISFTTGES